MRTTRHGQPLSIRRLAPLALLLGLGPRLAVASSPGVPAFVVDGGTQVTISGATQLTLDRSLLNYGTFTPAIGSIVVVHDAGSPVLFGVPLFADLSIGLADTASLGSPSQVGGTLTLTEGLLSLAGHDLVVNSVSGGSAASYVMTPDTLGRLARTVGNATPVLFPIGGAHYDPVTIRTTTGTDVFRVAVMDAPPTTGLVPATALTPAWSIAQVNAPGADGNLSLTLQWNLSEQGAQFDRSFSPPNGAWAWRWLGGTWVPQSGVRVSDNGASTYPAIDGLTTLSVGLWTLAGTGQLLAAPLEPPPHVLELSPARPNPAHGAAVIRYGLPARARVRLALYSVLGQRVATLADGEQDAGWHEVSLDRTSLANGVYFCRLESASVIRSSRLVWLGR